MTTTNLPPLALPSAGPLPLPALPLPPLALPPAPREPVTCTACGCVTERYPGNCHVCGAAENFTVTDWFPVSMDGWYAPVHDGFYEWRRIDDGFIERVWWSTSQHRAMTVSGQWPQHIYNAWRGVRYGAK